MSSYSDEERKSFYENAKKILGEESSSREHDQRKKTLEYSITRFRVQQLENYPINGNYDLDHLSTIHQKIFDGLYDFAGKQRLHDIFKQAQSPTGKREVGYFLPAKDIHFAFLDFKEDLEKNNFLKNLDKDSFVDKFSSFYARINEIHPFEEGNGRATKLMMQQLANEAGYRVEYENVNQKDWNYASKRSLNDQAMFHGSELITQKQDLSYLKEVMHTIVVPMQLDYEKLKQQLTPVQKQAFNTMHNHISQIFKDHPDQLAEKLDALNAKLPDFLENKYELPELEKKDKGRDR